MVLSRADNPHFRKGAIATRTRNLRRVRAVRGFDFQPFYFLEFCRAGKHRRFHLPGDFQFAVHVRVVTDIEVKNVPVAVFVTA